MKNTRKRFAVTLTAGALENLGRIAETLNISRSRVIEQLAAAAVKELEKKEEKEHA